MRVLVTGGAGLVGSAICADLIQQGHHVVSISRNAYHHKTDVLQQISYHQIDIANPLFFDEIAADVAPCDAIVHAAAMKSHDLYDARVSFTNCIGTQQLLKLAADWNVNSFVNISSMLVIGKPQSLPITETHTLQPLTAYHATKVFGEHLVQLAQAKGTKAANLRIPSPIGTQNLTNNKTILYTFIERALRNEAIGIYGQGTRKQNYVDVRDIAHAVTACITHQAVGTFNIANNATISNLALAKLCIAVLDSSSVIQFVDKPDPEDQLNWDISIQKAHEHFGYAPKYSMEDSINMVAKYYENHLHQ